MSIIDHIVENMETIFLTIGLMIILAGIIWFIVWISTLDPIKVNTEKFGNRTRKNIKIGHK